MTTIVILTRVLGTSYESFEVILTYNKRSWMRRLRMLKQRAFEASYVFDMVAFELNDNAEYLLASSIIFNGARLVNKVSPSEKTRYFLESIAGVGNRIELIVIPELL